MFSLGNNNQGYLCISSCSSLGETIEVHFSTLNITAQLELDSVMPQGVTFVFLYLLFLRLCCCCFCGCVVAVCEVVFLLFLVLLESSDESESSSDSSTEDDVCDDVRVIQGWSSQLGASLIPLAEWEKYTKVL